MKFLPYLESKWPAYVDEMKGLAEASHVPFESILALNVRTEIAYGMSADGCTAFAWKSDQAAFMGQNWDVSRHVEPLRNQANQSSGRKLSFQTLCPCILLNRGNPEST